MALDPSTGNSILPATLESAALHPKYLGLYHSEHEIMALRHSSLRHFKLPAIGQNPVADDNAIATPLMLCLCDILAGGEKANSWQLHLQGAVAIMKQISGREHNRRNLQESHTRKFLRPWCESLEVLSLLGPNSKLTGQAVDNSSSDYVDEFHGFSRTLIPLFQEANLLLMERESLQEALEIGSQGHKIAEKMSYTVQERCRAAISQVKSSLARMSYTFHPSIESHISTRSRSDFISLNHAFHYGILLHLYRRVQYLPYTHPNIEASVQAIIRFYQAYIFEMKHVQG
ncbi:fungal-specific transcription factor domain-containing protein [Talaromyces proteolyticus]|uniref:Fungal-specific transcription factor domain-containing protein n=1 Tax=Talaromyces proteolyticus TaxID=1131652 RepID=A0AAD4KR47_9EURO|nr:fungal-specific transcription factor domain-containing protein [Talaromyces proteolyticus]KAH8698584.1 fungal-specific transcription factor domain-containing protein [Talaromyces proteolyticus]